MAFVFWLILFAMPLILKLAGVAALASVPMWVVAIPLGIAILYCLLLLIFYVVGAAFMYKLFSR